jgi:hypothetical protein
MRYHEIRQALKETDYSAFVEDDAENHCSDVLASVLQNIIFSAEHAEIPKIRVDALIHLEALKSCQQNDEGIKNLIANIKDDDAGVKYVYLNRQDEFGGDELQVPGDADATKTAPEKTVSSMAKRAAGNRS